jgi:hypothetical protein
MTTTERDLGPQAPVFVAVTAVLVVMAIVMAEVR